MSTDATTDTPEAPKLKIRFRVALAIAAERGNSKGTLTRDQAKLLRSWLLNPNPNQPAPEDVEAIAFAIGKDNAVVPNDATLGTFDWAAFFAFIEKILPIILALLGG
jgi:hypothetical protein